MQGGPQGSSSTESESRILVQMITTVLYWFQVSFTLNVTVAYGAPSCFARSIVLTSGYFEPAIVINQGDTLRVRFATVLEA